MKNNTISRFLEDHIDDTIPEWHEMALSMFCAVMVGLVLMAAMYWWVNSL